MRRIDKKLNIIKLNILTENRYIQNKFGLNENCESGLDECYDISEEEIEEETTDESLKRDTTKSVKEPSEPKKKVVGSDNVNAAKKMATDPYKLMKGIESQHRYSESEDEN